MSTCAFLLLLFSLRHPSAADLSFYFGDAATFNQNIPTPAEVLGFDIGTRHLRHDQLVRYLERLAEASDRVSLSVIGETHEGRPLVHLVITAPDNHARLEDVRTRHLALSAGKGDPEQGPVVVWMGYSVHGNEPSGTNAAPLVAYYLAAANGLDDILADTVIVFDPCLNPDGMDRFAGWVNGNVGRVPVADDATREHREPWPGGRTNHYWFDLNRDWLLLVHPESRARLAQFHRWRPNVLTDHHEMGTDATFFFQPGVPSRRNPLTSEDNVTLTKLLAGYHARALDARRELYFTEQVFDDFYYGKGSTYPDIHGAVGILFEQAGTRGLLRENSYGALTFADTVKNQVTSSLSTLQGSYENRRVLLRHQQAEARRAGEEARKAPLAGYVFGEPDDPMRALLMAQTLRRHEVAVYPLAQPVRVGKVLLEQGFVVPTDQPQYHLIRSLFETQTRFADSTFYDVSSWHFPSAFGVVYEGLHSLPSTLYDRAVTEPVLPAPAAAAAQGGAYAYAFDWHPYYAPRAAYRLAEAGVKLRYAERPFRAQTVDGPRDFSAGTVLIPRGIQDLDDAALADQLRLLADEDGIAVAALTTGLTPEGIDLGSGSFSPLNTPSVALVSGDGTSPGSVGTLWHLLDVRMQMPVSLVDTDRLGRTDLQAYSHLVMVDGRYNDLSDGTVAKIKTWTEQGGTLILIGSAVRWAEGHKLTTAKAATEEEPAPTGERLPYGEREQRRAAEQISGAVFWADLDLTHPLGFGYSRPRVAMFRDSTLFLAPADNPYGTPLQYTPEPLVSGYISAANLTRLSGSAAVICHRMGRGSVVAMADEPNFRGFWLGTNKLFLNSLFFSLR